MKKKKVLVIITIMLTMVSAVALALNPADVARRAEQIKGWASNQLSQARTINSRSMRLETKIETIQSIRDAIYRELGNLEMLNDQMLAEGKNFDSNQESIFHSSWMETADYLVEVDDMLIGLIHELENRNN